MGKENGVHSQGFLTWVSYWASLSLSCLLGKMGTNYLLSSGCGEDETHVLSPVSDARRIFKTGGSVSIHRWRKRGLTCYPWGSRRIQGPKFWERTDLGSQALEGEEHTPGGWAEVRPSGGAGWAPAHGWTPPQRCMAPQAGPQENPQILPRLVLALPWGSSRALRRESCRKLIWTLLGMRRDRSDFPNCLAYKLIGKM